MKLYLLMGLGFGNDELAFEPLGVFSSRAKADQARVEIIGDAGVDGDDVELEFRIDELVLDECGAGF
jgi:hypothetical protein